MAATTVGTLRKLFRLSLSALVAAALAVPGQHKGQSIPLAATDSLSVDTSAAPAASGSRRSDLRVVRRTYRYRRQIGLALFMMCFVALALTTTQTFNPE